MKIYINILLTLTNNQIQINPIYINLSLSLYQLQQICVMWHS